MLEVPGHIFGVVDHLLRHFDPCFLGNLLEIQNQLWLAIFERLQTTNNCHSNFWSAEVSCKICNSAVSNSLRPVPSNPSTIFAATVKIRVSTSSGFVNGEIHYHLLAQDVLFHWRSCEPPSTNCSFTSHLAWKMWHHAPSKILSTCCLTKSSASQYFPSKMIPYKGHKVLIHGAHHHHHHLPQIEVAAQCSDVTWKQPRQVEPEPSDASTSHKAWQGIYTADQ